MLFIKLVHEEKPNKLKFFLLPNKTEPVIVSFVYFVLLSRFYRVLIYTFQNNN